MLLTGSIIIILWGIAHLIPTKKIVAGYGDISEDNKKIITMEWIAEGFTLIFLGIFVLMLILTDNQRSVSGLLVINLVAGMLLVLALLSLFTGATTKILPMKICPLIKICVAILFMYGT